MKKITVEKIDYSDFDPDIKLFFFGFLSGLLVSLSGTFISIVILILEKI